MTASETERVDETAAGAALDATEGDEALDHRGGWRLLARAGGAAAAVFVLALAVLWVLAAPESERVAGPMLEAPLPAPAPALPAPAAPSTTVSGIDSGLTVPAVTPASYARVGTLPADPPIAPADDRALLQDSPAGPLPRIAADGREPRRVYAHPFDRRDDRSRIAVVVVGIGLAQAASRAAIDRLPGAVSLAVDPLAAEPDAWSQAARRGGHEVLVMLPLESAAAPYRDHGPQALLAAAGATDNRQRLEAVLGRVTGAAGVFAIGGGAFGDPAALRPVAAALDGRGLLLVDAGDGTAFPLWRAADSPTLPRVRVDVWIDETPSAAAIDRALARLQVLAGETFAAVGAAQPLPVTLERLRAFAAGLDERRFVLAPVSAVASVRGGRP